MHPWLATGRDLVIGALIGVVATAFLGPTVERWRDQLGELITPATTGFKPDAAIQCEIKNL